MFESDGLRPI
jgi:WD40 repeat protein